MNRYSACIMIVGCLFMCACGKTYTRLDVVFGEQPEGGTDVTQVFCIIVGRLVDGDTPIQARVKWHGEDLNHENYMEYWSDTWTFRSEEPEELGAGVQAPSGYVLAGYFWFEITWEDEDETPHSLLSDTAECKTSVDKNAPFSLFQIIMDN